MTRQIELPYGSRPLPVRVAAETVVVDLPPVPAGRPVEEVLPLALDAPIESPRLETLARPGDRVTVIVSDATRDEPRGALLDAVRERLPAGVRLTVAVANGTHAPGDFGALGLPARLAEEAAIVNHDARDDRELVLVGQTTRGTPLRVNRCLVECDLAVATGRIKPHYFAGFGAGAKALFPGLGANDDIRHNHRLKTTAGARPGVVDGNPCREDLEEIVDRLQCGTFLLNLVTGPDGSAQSAVAGNVRAAFRVGASLCRPLYSVRAPRARTIIVSDALPLTGSLYQASKLVATAAPLLEPGGTIVVAAECPDGTGPVDTVNQAIYDIGIRPRLPTEHRIVLVSSLSPQDVAETYCDYAERVEDVAPATEPALVLRRAGIMIPTL